MVIMSVVIVSTIRAMNMCSRGVVIVSVIIMSVVIMSAVWAMNMCRRGVVIVPVVIVPTIGAVNMCRRGVVIVSTIGAVNMFMVIIFWSVPAGKRIFKSGPMSFFLRKFLVCE